MKLLVLILTLAISAQPLQAGFCAVDMDNNQDTKHHMDDGVVAAHDCCDADDSEAEQERGCNGEAHCAPCFVGAQVLPFVARLQLDWVPQHAESKLIDLVMANHSTPPFRPPIS